MQSLALRKRKPQETQALALASSQSWLPLLRPSIPVGWRLRLLRKIFTPILKFSFQNPFTETENDIVHCVLILQGVMSWEFRPALPLAGGSDPGGMSGGVMSANLRTHSQCTRTRIRTRN